MNNLIETILINSSITTVLGTVCFFFIKAWYNKKSSKDLEIHKGDIREEIETQLESHKGDIQKDLEHLKDSYIKENLESTRFVEVICRQRIEWLEKVREEVAYIVANTHLYIETIEGNKNTFGFNLLSTGIELLIQEQPQIKKVENVANKALSQSQAALIIKTDLLKIITRLKLRLNPINDIEFSSTLDELVKSIETKQQIIQLNIILKKIITHSESMLKQEWSRVKKEVVAGKEVDYSYDKPQHKLHI